MDEKEDLKVKRIRTGKTSMLIILSLELLSLIYQLLKLDYPTINSIVQFIDDASFFITIISLSFGMVSVIKTPKSHSLAIMSFINIIVTNHLYSNTKLLTIFQWLQHLNKNSITFIALICIAAGYIIYKILKGKKNKLKQLTKSLQPTTAVSIPEGNMPPDKSMLAEKPTHIKAPEKERTLKTYLPEESNDKDIILLKVATNKKSLNIIVPIILAICFGVILWSILDYILFKKLSLQITRPNWVPNTLVYIGIICFVILLAILIICFFIFCHKVIVPSLFKKILNQGSTFRWSAVLSIIFEILLIIFAGKLNAIKFSDTFLSAITENWFSSIFALIIFFLILQIFWTIFFHLIRGTSNDDLVPELKEHITRIEKKIVKTTCNIIESCVDLFDFIPDFFTTIGIILLDKSETETTSPSEKEQDDQKR